MINGLDNVYYFVSDVKRAAEFYGVLLGLKVLEQDEHWASISLGSARLGLHKGSDFFRSSERRGGATVTLSVDDIDQAYEYFSAKGVRFLGPISRNPWGSHVSFADPDGNLLDLRQGPKEL